MDSIQRKADLLKERLGDQRPDTALSLALLGQGILQCLHLGMTPASVEEATRFFLARYQHSKPVIERPSDHVLKKLVAEVLEHEA